jgi:crossover junction endodeoxyribonuclease RuvC
VTLRLVFGADPGIAGAVAALADGEVTAVFDVPVRPRKTSNNDEVDFAALLTLIREVRARHPGAAELAAVEDVQPMPSQGAKRGMGAVSAFQYGRTVAAFHHAFEALGVPRQYVHASRWKKAVGMPTRAQIEDDAQRKDYARTLVMQKHPALAEQLKTKGRGQPRAEAVLIAECAYREMVGADTARVSAEAQAALV